jgi:hypothetical protein
MQRTNSLLARAGALWSRIGGRAQRVPVPAAHALSWSRRDGQGSLEAIPRTAPIRLDDLLCIDRQKAAAVRNTRQFLAGLPANNLLLWGPRGTGKSSLIRALFNEFQSGGLHLVELPREFLHDLPEIGARLSGAERRFLVYCDDLSFDTEDPGFRWLKTALDGSIRGLPENVLIYATSNRRHLMPETMRENLESRTIDGELHLAEGLEEKLSLAERFGICLAFHPFAQEQYLAIARHWLRRYGAADPDSDETRTAALQWALERGSRSGRSAWQFARDRAGSQALEKA